MTATLQPLRAAIAAGDPAAIRAAIPEPPDFLPTLLSLPPAERDAVVAGVIPVLETDEDRWELIEAAAQDSIARPELRAFLAVVPHIPASLLSDARKLATAIHDPEDPGVAARAVDDRADELGVALGA